MSSTRKVTIDSGRRIATGDALDSSKKKSVFERLGGNGSAPKSVVKTKASKKISSENQSEDDEGDDKEKRKVVSFTVKKNSLVEDSENKLKKKKQENEEDIAKPKKKKKQKVEGASLKPKKNLDGLLEEGNTVDTFVRKKKKKILSPTLSVVKKKKKSFVEEEQEPFPLKKNLAKPLNDLRKKQTDSPVEQEDLEKRKKKIKQGKQSPLETNKKVKKNVLLSPTKNVLLSPTKKKVKPKISDDENNFDNDKFYKKQNKHSFTSSDDDDEILHKKKMKKATGKKIKTSVSLSPIKDLSSFDSDSVGLTSESEHDERIKKKRKTYFNDRGKDTFYERPHFVARQNTDMQNRVKKNFRDFDKGRDDRIPERRQNQARQYETEDLDNRRHDDFHRNKRTEQYNSDDRFTSRIDNRQTYNHYNKRNDYNQWHDNDCDERRTDMRFDDRNHNIDDRCNNRNQNNRYDYRDTRDNIDNQRDYYREDNRDFRTDDATDWNHDYADNEHYNNRGHHFYRARGRGYRGGRGNFRGNYNSYNNNDGLVGRYNQRTSPTHRDYDNYNDVQGEYIPERSNRYDYHDYHKDRSKERKFELSPIRDPNFIGSISRKRELSEEGDVNKRRKRKHEVSKKKSSKDKSESEATDDESKKKKAKIEKPAKDLKENDQSKVSKKITPLKQTVSEELPKSTKMTKDVKQKENDDKSKEKKLTSNKKLLTVKDISKDSVSKEEKIKSEDNIKKDDLSTKRDEKNLIDTKSEKRLCKEKSTSKDETEDLNDNRKGKSSERTGITTGWSSSVHSEFRKGRSPVHSIDSRRSPAHSTDSRKDRSPESRDSYKRGRSPIKYERRRSPLYNRDGYRRESYVFDRNKNHDVSRGWERNKSPNNRGDTPLLDGEKRIMECLDVYESISDEELDLFDDNDEEFPQPASVLEVDWSLLQIGGNSKVDKENESLPEFKRKLFPGNILAEIGYSPSLLKKPVVERVQDACFSCMRIESRFLESSEEVKLQTGMAATVRKVFNNRSARKDLFLKCLTGLKNDLALRRELRKPVDKIGSNSTIFYSAPSQPADYDLFLNSVDLYDKKESSNGYPLHISLVSKVGSVIICKS